MNDKNRPLTAVKLPLKAARNSDGEASPLQNCPVKGTGKNHKGGMTVYDVLERCLRTGEPIPEDYKHRDPNEII